MQKNLFLEQGFEPTKKCTARLKTTTLNTYKTIFIIFFTFTSQMYNYMIYRLLQ